ncbi:MAG: hypothetical protein AUJ49_09140 [Desulfovibrionaceae bacterium CG1_02_65_16]|nr:MAG: hypothetical protein AUJ49_09140 [Desulfovibrionaceae bacterium CG1_02_65_16]
MRISGYGSGFGQSGGERDRAAAFRARHSIGQRVKGRILRREQNGLFWVQVGGEELLARLEVQADPGDTLTFVVRALTPEIMLQALPGGVDADDLPGLVQRFRAAREVFETQHHAVYLAACGAPPQAALRREAFKTALSADETGRVRFADVTERLARINAAIAARGNVQALYEPWLLPGLRRLEQLRTARTAVEEHALSALDAACGGIEARLHTGPEARLNVAAEHPEHAGALMEELTALARGQLVREPKVLGPSRLRPSPLGGILGELFGDVPTWSSGGLNTRV